jgi:hypothetical protein
MSESPIVGYWNVTSHGKGPNAAPVQRAVSEPLPAKRVARVSVVVHSEIEGKKKRREVPIHQITWSVEPPEFAQLEKRIGA